MGSVRVVRLTNLSEYVQRTMDSGTMQRAKEGRMGWVKNWSRHNVLQGSSLVGRAKSSSPSNINVGWAPDYLQREMGSEQRARSNHKSTHSHWAICNVWGPVLPLYAYWPLCSLSSQTCLVLHFSITCIFPVIEAFLFVLYWSISQNILHSLFNVSVTLL